MNIHELQELVAEGESDHLEFKKSTGQRTEAAKTVCAMLNGLGGFVLFGVTNKREVVGQLVATTTLEDIASELRKIEPPVFPDIETVNIKGGSSVIVLTVSGGSGSYTYDGRPYLRHGPTTIIMPRHEYERRLVEYLHATRRWENEPVPEGVSVRDLDKQEIQLTLDNAIRLGRIESTVRRDLTTILRGLELIHDDKLLNAAVVLYGKTERLKTLYPQMSVRLARFRGINRLADFSDNRQYWGHAFSLLRKTDSFLMDHVPIAGRVIAGKMVREDQPLYPPRSTREALANALCHRDYTIPGGAVAVAMYDDHLEIVNPGTLHFGITPKKLTKPHESRPWNPIIANVFYRAGIIERWGSGTLNIIDWCTQNANPKPTWHEQAGSVYVTFLPAALPVSQHEVERLATKSAANRPEVAPEVTPEVTPEVRLATVIVGEMTRQTLRQVLGLKDDEHFRKTYLLPALVAGLIEMTIPDKPRSSKQRYRLTEKGRVIVKNRCRN